MTRVATRSTVTTCTASSCTMARSTRDTITPLSGRHWRTDGSNSTTALSTKCLPGSRWREESAAPIRPSSTATTVISAFLAQLPSSSKCRKRSLPAPIDSYMFGSRTGRRYLARTLGPSQFLTSCGSTLAMRLTCNA